MRIEREVAIEPELMLLDDGTHRRFEIRGASGPNVIGNYALTGSRVTMVEDGAAIPADAVVIGDTPAGGLWGGVPASHPRVRWS